MVAEIKLRAERKAVAAISLCRAQGATSRRREVSNVKVCGSWICQDRAAHINSVIQMDKTLGSRTNSYPRARALLFLTLSPPQTASREPQAGYGRLAAAGVKGTQETERAARSRLGVLAAGSGRSRSQDARKRAGESLSASRSPFQRPCTAGVKPAEPAPLRRQTLAEAEKLQKYFAAPEE